MTRKKSPEREVLRRCDENAQDFVRQFERGMRHMRGEPEPPVPESQRNRFSRNVREAVPKAREMLDVLERDLANGKFFDEIVLSEGDGIVIVSDLEHITRFEIKVDLEKGAAVRVQNTPGGQTDCLSLTVSKKQEKK
ncbi:hypothetical protein HY091_03325 [Candidatus Kaiserbacteria bacterium]|nr:hypothetical protein [Candidatus Kaiserbacteria bacterium]